MPIQNGESGLLAAPVNLWSNGSIESKVQVGGVSYSNMGNSPFLNTIYGHLLINRSKRVSAPAIMEALTPHGSQQLTNYVVITEEVEPLRPTFKTVSLAGRFAGVTDESEAQGNVLSSSESPARDAIRSSIPSAHTTLQPQRDTGGNRQSNPANNNLYCLIGVPEDYNELLVNQAFLSTATYMYYNTDPLSENFNEWIITDGLADAAKSPTSIAAATDESSVVSGISFSKIPFTYEALVFKGFLEQDASDVINRRRVGVFQRCVNYVQAASSAAVNKLKESQILPLGELISAGWGSDANTPSTVTRTTKVTAEVLLPYIPVGTQLVRIQANDGEASEPKSPFRRLPIPQDHFCMITRYGLATVTDVAAIMGEHQRRLSMAVLDAMARINNMQSLPIYEATRMKLQTKQAFSEFMFGVGVDENGLAGSKVAALAGGDQNILSDLLSDVVMLMSFPNVDLMILELATNLLFGAGKLQNPISTLVANRSAGLAGLVYNQNRIASGRNGIGVNGQLLEGGSFDDVKYGSFSQGLLRSVPVENNFPMAAGSFDFKRFAEISYQWQSNEGANVGYVFTDAEGISQVEHSFYNSASLYRKELTMTNGTYMGITINEIDFAGMKLKFIHVPELTWATNPAERGTYTFINFGTEDNPTVQPFFTGTPMSILKNEQLNGKLVASYGVRTETGLICRGFKRNAFRITRNT